MEDLTPIIEEYPLDYCNMLEEVYGPGLMSEGGLTAIDKLFSGLEIKGKKILDIGSGLGGLALHLATKYNCDVTGLEINQEMVKEANKRVCPELKNKIRFTVYNDFKGLPFKTNTFDIICSKGVLVHVQNKGELFTEIFRILKPKGNFVINDWLSPTSKQWSSGIQKMCELEGLTLFATSLSDYLEIIKKTKFKIKNKKNVSKIYSRYNDEIVSYLKSKKHEFSSKFSSKLWKESIEGYKLIAESQLKEELIVMEFILEK